MFGLGVQELLFIFVLALLIFGPKKLPEIGRTLGRGMKEFRRATTDIQRTINTEIALEEEKTAKKIEPPRRAPLSPKRPNERSLSPNRGAPRHEPPQSSG